MKATRLRIKDFRSGYGESEPGMHRASFHTIHSAKLLSNDGIALMMVIWIFAILSIIALNFLYSQRWNTASARNLKEETLSYYLALSGYHQAVHYILSDKAPSFDFIDSEGNFWLDQETEPVTGKKVTEDGEIEINISDEGSRININYANTERLKKLFDYIGIADDEIPEIIDSIMDWKDPGDEHHLLGAEDDYYEGLEEPYTAKNALFDVPEEFALVKGISKEYLYGTDEVKPLLSFITTFGRGAININTVSSETMQLLGLNELQIEAILKQRNTDAGGFRFITREFSAFGLNAVLTSDFRIEVTAKAHDSKLASRIVAVVNRRHSTDGFRVKTLYWRESAEIDRS